MSTDISVRVQCALWSIALEESWSVALKLASRQNDCNKKYKVTPQHMLDSIQYLMDCFQHDTSSNIAIILRNLQHYQQFNEFVPQDIGGPILVRVSECYDLFSKHATPTTNSICCQMISDMALQLTINNSTIPIMRI